MTSYRLLSGTALSIVAIAMHAPAGAQKVSPASIDMAAPAADTQPAPSPGDQSATSPANTGTSTSAGTSPAEIVVTGTLIRGVAPTGTNVVSLTAKDITATGASSANQVLAHIPQITTAFNSTPSTGGGPLSTIARPDIRRLNGAVGSFGAGGNATLVMVDGHRIVGAGGTYEVPDPDVIPTAVLERVEVVPDGGSSIYGSDAIGGVINFITKKKFDGIQVQARGGGAEDYHTFDGSVTAGKSWSTGSAYISYSYVGHGAIFGRDRGYAKSLLAESGSCNKGTVYATSGGVTTSYALPGFVPNTISTCDPVDGFTVYPAEHRHSVFASFTQDFGSRLSFDVRGFYTNRHVVSAEDANQRNFIEVQQTVTPSNPFYTPVPNDPGSQQVSFSFTGALSPNAPTTIAEWGITPVLTYHAFGDWQVHLLGNYGHSRTVAYEPAINAGAEAAALAATTLDTALDPYDVTKTNPDVLANILARNYGFSDQEMINGRLTVDGTLFDLPGGAVKLAFGGEINRSNITRGSDATLTVAQVAANDYSGVVKSTSHRTVASGFGELSVPIFGAENARPLLQALTLNASARYDHYSDFGSTTNPKFGVSYKPVNWLTLRGNFGKSFTAPALADTTTVGSLINVLPFSPFLPVNAPAGSATRPTLFVLGGNPNLKPQTAKTYSFGTDIKPTFIPGLTINATYFNVNFKNQIAFVNFQSPDLFASYYSQYVIINPTQAQAQAIANQVQSIAGATSIASLYATGNTPFVLIDTRRQNLGHLKTDGIDFNVAYLAPTSFGSINASVSGTYTLSRKFAATSSAGYTDQFKSPGTSRLALVASIGATVGPVNGSLTLNHSAGYKISPAVIYNGGIYAGGTQTHVRSFNTVDAFFAYDVPATGVMSNLQLTLTVNNLFSAKPPFYGNADLGYTNGQTLGRLVQVGFSKKF